MNDTVAGTVTRIFINSSILRLYEYAFLKQERNLTTIVEAGKERGFNKPDWLLEGDSLDEWNAKNLFSYEIRAPLKDEDKLC